MFKAGYRAFFTLLIVVSCFAESDDTILSKEEKEAVRSSLYFLLEAGEAEIKHNEKLENQRDLKGSMRKLFLRVIDNTAEEEDEGIEEWGEMEHLKKKTEESKKGGVSSPMKESKWKTVLDPKNNSYVRELFQTEERLQKWMKRDAEPIYFAIQQDNLDMVRFFVEESGMINAARGPTHFSPLHFAILTRRLHIIRFFLDHPKTNLGQKSIWGDNLFHLVFLSGGQGKGRETWEGSTRSSKLVVLRLLLQEEYFSKILYLLNTPNYHNETVLDFAYRDLSSYYDYSTEDSIAGSGNLPKSATIRKLLKDNGALTYKDLIKDRKALALIEEGMKREENLCATHFSKSRSVEGIQGYPN